MIFFTLSMFLRLIFTVIGFFSCILATMYIRRSGLKAHALRFVRNALWGVSFYSLTLLVGTIYGLVSGLYSHYGFGQVLMSLNYTVGAMVEAICVGYLAWYLVGVTDFSG